MREPVLRSLRIPLSVTSWGVFTISLVIYWLTADTGVSYWDCPEYVLTASRLEIGHPPGNPVWTLAMRAATIPFPVHLHAYVINLCSGIMMAFASFFLCRIIFMAICANASRLFGRQSSPVYKNFLSGSLAAGSSLCFAFCDSVWFSAVEAEVYAMSAMLTSAGLWIMTVWWFSNDVGKRKRLLVLLAYLTGLSLGVHQLNLLCIPVYGLIMLYRYHPEKVWLSTVWFRILVSFGIVALVLFAMMPGILKWAGNFELFAVNGQGWRYGSGVLIFFVILALLLVFGLISANSYEKSSKRIWADLSPLTAMWMLIFVIVGYSSFSMIIIRGAAAVPVNEGVPGDIFSIRSYIERDQYPSTPLIYGRTPYSEPMFVESHDNGLPVYSRYALKKEKPIYVKREDNPVLTHRSRMLSYEDSAENKAILSEGRNGYLLSDYKFSQILTPELNMWFPRMTSRDIRDREDYSVWAGMKEGNMEKVAVSEAFDTTGNVVSKMNPCGERKQKYSYRPTGLQNIRYFLTYQTFYMYLRYLLWNFCGRQNDFPSSGELEHGNFITGITFIDEAMLGDQSELPREIGAGNPGRNVYYGIPFILGIIGIIFLSCGGRISRRMLSVIALFFFMTGMAIVIYLNQDPGEPRERDYTFLGSYMAFAMWIAAGMTLIVKLCRKLAGNRAGLILCCFISFFPAGLMAAVNFDDHNRRGRFETEFFAEGILEFEDDAIIFSHGDNSTFPLWYASEVTMPENRHTIIDVSYLSVPSYLTNLMKQGEKGVELKVAPGDILYNAYAVTKISPEDSSGCIPLDQALTDLYTSNRKDNNRASLPASVLLPGNNGDSLCVRLREFTQGSSYLSFRDLMLLDVINSNSRLENPKIVFFPTDVAGSVYRPLRPALRPWLFGNIYAPGMSDSVYLVKLGLQLDRELARLEDKDFINHYQEPVVADRTVRYRGGLILAAGKLLEEGDTLRALKTSESIERYLPYSKILPGNFTLADTTFYEAERYLRLLRGLGDSVSAGRAAELESLMNHRKSEWLDYYRSLSPERRAALSPRSRRLYTGR